MRQFKNSSLNADTRRSPWRASVCSRSSARTSLQPIRPPNGPPRAPPVPAPERFSATTASMTPRDVSLRIDLREWSDEAARAEVVAALSGDSDAPKALASLPT